MPHRAPGERIQDILRALARIGSVIEGMTFEAFAADQRTIEAVQSVRTAEIGE